MTEVFIGVQSVACLYRLRTVVDYRVSHRKGAFMAKANKRGRDSVTGRFITIEEAKSRPRETTVVTIRKPCPKGQGKQSKTEEP
jgi:hypothetical protein